MEILVFGTVMRWMVGISLCFACVWAGPVPSLQDQVYENVAKSFPRELIRILPDLQVFIDKIFLRLQCGSLDPKNSSCVVGNCLRADEVFQQAGYLPGTEVLTPKTFAGVSVPILFYALNLDTMCAPGAADSIPCMTDTWLDKLGCWANMLLENRTGITETVVQGMIDKISRTYVANTTFTKPEEIIRAAMILKADFHVPVNGSITKGQVPVFAALMLSRLFYGMPVAVASSTPSLNPDFQTAMPNTLGNVTPESFITSLFDLEAGTLLSVQRLQNIADKLNIGKKVEHIHGPHKIVKRRAEDSAMTPFNKTCWSLESLRQVYKIKDTLSQQEFEHFCPALIQQSYYDACEPVTVAVVEKQTPIISDAEKYGYGAASVVIISFVSILGIVFIPLFKKSVYEYALQGFIALGVGTLCGDALMHLLPEALNLHNHGSEPVDDAVAEHFNSGHSEENEESHTALWRCVACLGAIYVFFLWEILLHAFIHHRSKGKRGAHNHDHDHDDGHGHSHIPDQETFAKARAGELVVEKDVTDVELKTAKPNDHVAHTHSETFLGLAPIAWMILLGDALHNFGDGLTIAAAFSIDVSSGISTSIAIFCHEVPHELGDFAILLSTGMSFKRALVLNFVTAIACVCGFFIGIPIAANEDARQWIFVVAAGMFLYVGLADMLPELKNAAKDVWTILVQNVGLLAGFAIMLLIALYEDAIKI